MLKVLEEVCTAYPGWQLAAATGVFTDKLGLASVDVAFVASERYPTGLRELPTVRIDSATLTQRDRGMYELVVKVSVKVDHA